MGAFNITFVSRQPNFHFRGRFAKRTHTIRITGTCNGATETRLFRWSEP